MARFVNAETTNLTSFFEQHHFEEAFQAIEVQSQRAWRVWCSAGRGTYSIVMTALDAGNSRVFHLEGQRHRLQGAWRPHQGRITDSMA